MRDSIDVAWKVEHPQSRCRAGLARVEVTPPVGIYHRMWGAAAHDKATGVHRPLTATALALQSQSQSGPPMVLIALDHCLLWWPEMESLTDAVSADSGLDRSSLVVCFSHTHAAGLMDRTRADLPGGERIGPYLDDLANRLGALVRQAVDGMQSATICYGSGHCDLAAHRDFWDAQTEHYVCGFNPLGKCDDTVLVARVCDDQGVLLGTLVNYACHPTTLAWENTRISPDYVGAMRDVIERETGMPCFFLQGASGDVGPREGFVGDPAIADRNGRQLGFAALSVLQAMPPAGTWYCYQGAVVSGATLGIWAHLPVDREACLRHSCFQIERFTVDLAYRSDLPTLADTLSEREHWSRHEVTASDARQRQEARAMIERCDRRLTRIRHLPAGSTFPFPVVLARLGDAFWLAIEGEAYNALQVRLRARFPAHPIVIGTLAGGSRCSYLPTAETYGKGIYQESIAVLAAGCLETLTEAIAGRLHAMVAAGDNRPTR